MSCQPAIAPDPRQPAHAALSRYLGQADQPRDRHWLAQNIPCQEACPAHTRVPAYLDAIAHGRYDEAYRINLADNVFPAVLGRVCARPCEPACRHGWEGLGESVAICFSKRSAADFATKEPVALPALYPPSGKAVAIVGAGPAGLAAARDLALLGHQVTVFEQHHRPGGMMVQGIPRFRLPRAVVEQEIAQIERQGVTITCGVSIGRDLPLSHLRERFQALVIAAGTLKGNHLDLPGSHLRGVEHGLSFLLRCNEADPATATPLPPAVLVIGGGFTAMDCARSARRLGASQVSIRYRRSREEMLVTKEELEEIEHEGIPLEYMVSPVAFIGDEHGQVKAVRFVRTALGAPGADGRRQPVPIPGSEHEVPAGAVLLATGQSADTGWLGELAEQVLIANGRLRSGKEPVSPLAGLFFAGDYALGATTLIDAIGHAKRCVAAVDQFLMGEQRLREVAEITPAKGTGRTRLMDLIKRRHMPVLALEDRGLANEVETGYPSKIAREEARRCYLCHYKYEIDNQVCIYCEKCLAVKPRPACIVRVDRVRVAEDGRLLGFEPAKDSSKYPLLLIDQNQCIRCGACAEVCPVECISVQKVSRCTVPASAVAAPVAVAAG